MSLLGRVLPVGSGRRARVTELARQSGLWSGPKDASYQRWTKLIEPQLFSLDEPSDAWTFSLRVSGDAATRVVDLERTLLGLSGQSLASWMVTLTNDPIAGNAVSADVVAAIERARRADQRVLTSELGAGELAADPSVPSVGISHSVDIELRAGDVLAPHALREVALAFEHSPDAWAVLGDFDHLSASGDQRIDPVRIESIDRDACAQFDVCSAFAATRSGVAIESVRSALLDGKPVVVAVPLVLVHRRAQRNRQFQLPATDHDQVRCARSTCDVGPGVHGLGTRVRTPSAERVAVVIHRPLDGRLRQLQEMRLRRTFGHDDGVQILEQLTDGDDLGAVAAAARARGCSRVLFVDGAVNLPDPSLAAELAGVLERTDVFAVSPLVTAPSGLVVDAGLQRNGVGGLSARCGGLLRPPYDLPWVRPVDALSGRVVMVRTSSLDSHVDGQVDGQVDGLTELSVASFAGAAGLKLVWPHQRAVLDLGLADRDAASPGSAAWSHPMLANWFGDGIAGYRPLNDAPAESVW